MADTDRRGVFVSWSKPVAAEIARQIKPFLEDVLGTATIFMSQAMEGGTRWSMEIPQRLESCNAGLILVTKENRHEPWLHFEAGALSKHIDESRVVPLLCGASVGDIQGTPLSMFQAKALGHEEFLSVCISFGKAFGIPEDAIRRRFEKSWSELEASVASIGGASAPERQLGFPDLMAVLERISAQVTAIESSVRPTGASGALAAYARLPSGVTLSAHPRTLADLVVGGDLLQVSPEFRGPLAQILAEQEEKARKEAEQHGGFPAKAKQKNKAEPKT